MKIQQDFPELSKYIAEMPDKSLLSESSPTTYKPFKEYYISLINLVTKYAPTHMPKKITTNNLLLDKEGYPLYPASEDIYTVSKNETDLDPENIEILKSINNEDSLLNELDFKDDMSGDDLDIPGGELDDLEEQLGREDEENNYYSLGGDNHNDLEEDNG
ncbi:MAG: hypothetical protein WCP57_10355 [Bacteroidota bacterium]